MNNTITTTPPYIDYYGMTREPFGAAIEDDLFYAEPTRKQRLDILLHLAQYGNELMLVTGPEGSGKTTLLQQFKSKALDTWSIAHIEGKDGIDERKLVQQLFHQMGIEFHGATHAELLKTLEHHFDSLQRSARQAVLLIDDADQLPVTTINRVLEIAALTNIENKPLLRIILFGAPELETIFSDTQIQLPENLVRRTLDLSPFDNEHTAYYVLHRLSAAGFVANKPFTENVLHKLHKQSGGWPGRINDLTHNLLVDSLPATTTGKASDEGATVKPLRVIAAIAVITLMGSILVWQDDINNWLAPGKTPADSRLDQVAKLAPFEATPKITPAPDPVQQEDSAPDIATAAPEIIPEPALESTEENTPPQPASEAARDRKASLGEVLDSISTHAPDADTDINKTPEPTPNETVAAASAEKLQPVDQKQPTQASTPKETAKDLQQLPSRQEDWILGQNPKHYTLQLVAGKRIATIRKFIREHSLQNDLVFYRTTRHDKPWFGLLLGAYPGKQEAIDARSRLPKDLRTLTPWVRKLADVQKDIHKTRP